MPVVRSSTSLCRSAGQLELLVNAGAFRGFKETSPGVGWEQRPMERGFDLPAEVLGMLGPVSSYDHDTKGSLVSSLETAPERRGVTRYDTEITVWGKKLSLWLSSVSAQFHSISREPKCLRFPRILSILVWRPVISCRGTNKLRACINFLGTTIPVMPGKEWTMPDQKAFLMEELLHYMGVSPKDYQCQWLAFFQRWFQQWPEGATVLPTVSASTNLTDEQAAVLANAIDKQKQQLHQWLHWHAGAEKNRAINHKTYQLVDKLLKPKACINKDWEIYAKVYYHSRSESQEIQDKIFRMKEEQVVVASMSRDGSKEGVIDDEDDSIIDPKNRQLNIKQCGPALQHILEYMVTKTGWAFSVIMGGPDPLDAQGECIITRQAYSRFDGEVVQVYTEFLDDTFRRACEVSNPHQNADESESNNGEGGSDLEGDENDEDYPLNATTNTYTASMGAVAMPSTGVAMSSVNVATPLVNGMPSNVATSLVNVATPLVDGMSSNVASHLHACDSVPIPIAMPADATCITACDPTSMCVATPTATGQFQNPTSAYVTMPTLGSVARQSGNLVQACAPTQSAVDPLLALGVPNLVAGLPMTYSDVSHPILSTSNFDLSATMTFDFPPLSIFEMDVDAMMNGNTSLTAMGGPVQWSFGSTYGITGKENIGPLSVGRQKALLKQAAESNPGERKLRSKKKKTTSAGDSQEPK
ncbi:hypothetical protein EDD17DRAFT_1505240 [Pisolithus thermaeus]|nr:hypothetical protein EV401DRAFT_1887662 [Pisolithus croceorrhizus]KAI6166319.1 hypothetical protein EDD17DRAFT_1505240 [Pisolithus thermaeus]